MNNTVITVHDLSRATRPLSRDSTPTYNFVLNTSCECDHRMEKDEKKNMLIDY
jgi:hypothetical protein